MDYYAGIDVSLEASSVCLVGSAGKIIRETKVASDPDALIEYFVSLGLELKRIGLEAGPLSQWLHEGLTKAGFDVVLLETRHVKAALSAMIIKTDRKDARGIAQLLRMGWYRAVHSKSPGCQDVRALLTGRKLLQAKLRDVELSIRGIMRGYGLKVGEVSRGRFEARILELVEGHRVLKTVIGAMLQARHALWTEFTKMHREMLKIVRQDRMVRTALYEAAHIMLTRATRFSALKRWAVDVAKRRGMKRAKVALARKLATILHRMWMDESEFRWGKDL